MNSKIKSNPFILAVLRAKEESDEPVEKLARRDASLSPEKAKTSSGKGGGSKGGPTTSSPKTPTPTPPPAAPGTPTTPSKECEKEMERRAEAKSRREAEEEEREKMQVLVSNFTEEQLDRYEMYRRSAFPKAAIKRVRNDEGDERQCEDAQL